VTVRIVYETHSTTTDNERGIATGWLPGELSAAGIQQARQLGGRRRSDGISAVYSSDLKRAVDTVAIAFEGADVPVFQDARLRECDYGDLNGAPRSRWRDPRLYVSTPFPGGESYLVVVARTRELLGDLRARHVGERVLLVAHSANRYALDHLLNGRALEDLVTSSFEWRPGWEFELE
jgi:broad specificity phosphatase PhoE